MTFPRGPVTFRTRLPAFGHRCTALGGGRRRRVVKVAGAVTVLAAVTGLGWQLLPLFRADGTAE
ncbi:hypothetical protein NQK81_33570 [Amycolatopsis roodepoortensis]|uniref:hypothetical protein n=1 Tax=Amycolatopsis roodepoortensis TaxID=700274 RepID=UPI00214CCC73|nr:hypothetical protein [Amycolatopsis roodepoortensis]UUV36507.1 hypothetical protein NQK81_33570 [Amycolatopsis roodepoortensis]